MEQMFNFKKLIEERSETDNVEAGDVSTTDKNDSDVVTSIDLKALAPKKFNFRFIKRLKDKGNHPADPIKLVKRQSSSSANLNRINFNEEVSLVEKSGGGRRKSMSKGLLGNFLLGKITEANYKSSKINSVDQLIEQFYLPELKGKPTFDPSYKNTTLICSILRSFPQFQIFSNINKITDAYLKLAANHLLHVKVLKGEALYREKDDNPTMFYGILRGKISFTCNKTIAKVHIQSERGVKALKKSIFIKALRGTLLKHDEESVGMKKKKSFINLDEELDSKSDGYCFGHEELLTKTSYKTSAVAIEDTDLFAIKDVEFMKTFGRCIQKAENDKKEFVAIQVPVFYQNKHKYYSLYSRFIVHYKSKYDIVFHEKSFAKSIFIIYSGEFSLNKNQGFINKDLKRVTDFKQYIKIITLDKGDFAGLEALKIYAKYDYTLITESELSVIIEIVLDDLKDLKTSVINCLEPIRLKKEQIISEILENRNKMKDNMKITYRSEEMQCEMRVSQENQNKYIQKQCEKRLETMQKESEENKELLKSNKLNSLLNIKYECLKNKPSSLRKSASWFDRNIKIEGKSVNEVTAEKLIATAAKPKSINDKKAYALYSGSNNEKSRNLPIILKESETVEHSGSRNMQNATFFTDNGNLLKANKTILNESSNYNKCINLSLIQRKAKEKNPEKIHTYKSDNFANEKESKNRRKSYESQQTSTLSPKLEQDVIRNQYIIKALGSYNSRNDMFQTHRTYNSGTFDLPLVGSSKL